MTNKTDIKKTEQGTSFWRVLLHGALLPLFFLFCEALVRIFIYGSFTPSFLCHVLPFSVGVGLLLHLLFSLLPPLLARIAARIAMGLLTTVYTVHILYYKFFNAFFAWEMVGNGEALSSFWREILVTAAENWYILLLLWVPFVLHCVFCRRITQNKEEPWQIRGVTAMLCVVGFLCVLLNIRLDSGAFGNRYYHESGFMLGEGVDRFGLTDATFTDLRYFLFGRPQDNADLDAFLEQTTLDPEDIFAWNETTAEPITTPPQSDPPESDPPESDSQTATESTSPPVTEPSVPSGPNVLDIDFDALIASAPNSTVAEMHRYFASVEPTEKHQYTGLFAGKNLIYITAEALCAEFIDPVLTPTLSQMTNGGFVIDEFYNSVWGGSTATGEYANLTGLFYYYGCSPGAGQVWNYIGDNQIYLPFTAGNMLKSQGYTSYAFHNYIGSYYGRNQSHPLLGYTFLARDNGLDGLAASWPASDLQMAELTLPYYINSEAPFSVYYMTVSGHGYYGWSNNAMSRKHRERVSHLPYSEEVKSYIACQLELEDMLTYLVDALCEAGKLDDTVFVISADHYPYSLSPEAQMELYGIAETSNLDAELALYRNVGVIYCSAMREAVHVTKPCSSIDLLPTVLNLFGCPYDSRLLMGVDVLSDSDPLVILNQNGRGSAWNWINRYGSYSTLTRRFTAKEGVTFDAGKIQAYVNQQNQIIALKKKYSPQILYQNYYTYFRDAIQKAQSAVSGD